MDKTTHQMNIPALITHTPRIRNSKTHKSGITETARKCSAALSLGLPTSMNTDNKYSETNKNDYSRCPFQLV